MEKMRKALTIFIISLFCLTGSVTASPVAQCPQVPRQNDKRDCPQHRKGDGRELDDFKRDLQAFIAREAGLSESEARAFFPVYFEMKEKQRNLEHQRGRAIRQAAEGNMNERDCQRVLNEVVASEKKSQRIEAQYMERLKKIVGARKLIRAIDADRSFGRKVWKKMTNKNKG